MSTACGVNRETEVLGSGTGFGDRVSRRMITAPCGNTFDDES
jgi:hypothetical protein